MAENTSNQWSENGKSLGLFRSTEAILFFVTLFNSMHEWFTETLPKLTGKVLGHVKESLFEPLTKESEIREELTEDFVNKCSEYKKPDVGCIWEFQRSNASKIVGDKDIESVSKKDITKIICINN